MKKKDVEWLKMAVIDLHWMARRYADGRQSYVPSLFNDITRKLLSLGIKLEDVDYETIWAREADGRKK